MVNLLIPLAVQFLLILIVPIYVYLKKDYKLDVLMSVSLFLAYFYSIGYTAQFSMMAAACCDRFKALNQHVARKKFLTSYDVLELNEIHRKLLKIIKMINETISPILIPIFFSLFFTLTFNAYTEIRLLLRAVELKAFLLINNLMWTLIYFYLMTVVCYAAEALKSEGKKFKEICYGFLLSQNVSDRATKATLKVLLNSMDDSKLELKTIFFNIDWKLLMQVSKLRECSPSKLKLIFFAVLVEQHDVHHNHDSV